jgi:hypothetical protein
MCKSTSHAQKQAARTHTFQNGFRTHTCDRKLHVCVRARTHLRNSSLAKTLGLVQIWADLPAAIFCASDMDESRAEWGLCWPSCNERTANAAEVIEPIISSSSSEIWPMLTCSTIFVILICFHLTNLFWLFSKSKYWKGVLNLNIVI